MQPPDLNFVPTPPCFIQPMGGYRSTLTGRFLSRAYVDYQLTLWWTQELQRAWTRQVQLAALMLQATTQTTVATQRRVRQERHIVVDSDRPIRRKPSKRELEDKRRQKLWNQSRSYS